ncbi:MAG: hypothetical protein ACE5KE_09810, partial [Methanosarcinales archaeon]
MKKPYLKTILIISIIFFTNIAIASAESINLELVGVFPGIVRAVEVQGDYAYVCAGSSFLVLDISDPSN